MPRRSDSEGGTKAENGLNHHSNQNRNQNNGEKLKEMGERRSGLGFDGFGGLDHGGDWDA